MLYDMGEDYSLIPMSKEDNLVDIVIVWRRQYSRHFATTLGCLRIQMSFALIPLSSSACVKDSARSILFQIISIS